MKILVFVDPSFRGDWALSLAGDLARGLGGPVVLLTTAENLEEDPGLLDRAAGKLAEIHGVIVEKKSRPGLARDAIIAESTESHPAITIVPPAGRRGISRMIKGSRVKAVVHNAPSTVMVARKPVSDHIRTILVAVGGGPISETTVLGAQEIAKALQSKVTVLHVKSGVPIPFGQAAPEPVDANLSTLLDLLARAGIDAQIKVRDGMVVHEIIAECEEGHYDLVILGQHIMRRETGGIFSENLTEDIALECPIPVLVVRPRKQTATAGP
jgi:nucleotide-binding universal stress UspA family protein